jgi:hypothetical protein
LFLKKTKLQNDVWFFGIVKDVMLLEITSPVARNDASVRLCEASHKPKHALVASRS